MEDQKHPDWPRVHREYKIVFDGGTPCNQPKLGYGIGYGSYSINDGSPVRVNHGKPMSANAAELLTLICAVRRVKELENNPQIIALKIWGDSQIAINWANGTTPQGRAKKMSKNASVEFQCYVQTLRDCLKSFAKVTATWHPRVESVKLFGH